MGKSFPRSWLGLSQMKRVVADRRVSTLQEAMDQASQQSIFTTRRRSARCAVLRFAVRPRRSISGVGNVFVEYERVDSKKQM